MHDKITPVAGLAGGQTGGQGRVPSARVDQIAHDPFLKVDQHQRRSWPGHQ